MKYYLPLHIDGNNRGCQAITEATCLILNESSSNIIALSSNLSNDEFLGLGNKVKLQEYPKESIIFKIRRKLYKFFHTDIYAQECITYSQKYDKFLLQAKAGDVVLSTGGDMLCYSDNEVIYINDFCQSMGLKSILWGCSIGQENLTPKKVETLKKFDYIYVRESLTKNVMHKIGLNNVCCFPDPAFILEPTLFNIPEFLRNKSFVGVNLSNFVSSSSVIANDYFQNIKTLFDYIINKTDLNIILIPHVIWDRQDDRIVCGKIFNLFKQTGRCYLFETEKYNYTQIRYLISKCRFFIGARTHSVISAYRMCVPTVALGYSIKSRGIAIDLGLSEETVVDSRRWKSSNDILNAFRYLQDNESQIKEHLQEVIPNYVNSVWGINEIMSKMI